MSKEFDLVGHIMEYEGGEISEEGFLNLFSELIKGGITNALSLQGSYGRTANALIENKWIDEDGKILKGLPL